MTDNNLIKKRTTVTNADSYGYYLYILSYAGV